MALTWPEFLAQRTGKLIAWFPTPGASRTVLVCSHIWWTDQIAYGFLQAGCNVLLHFPFYLLYTDEDGFSRFDTLWNEIIARVREAKVDMILGGNTAAMLVHPRTGEMLHDAASAGGRPIQLVNWWWDEPRTRPPLARPGMGGDAGITPDDYLRLLANPQTTNAIWDIDIKEELEAACGLKNLIHLPLATLPEHWPASALPLEKRPLAACFLGNCHFTADWAQTDAKPLSAWARDIVLRKIADPRRPMQALIEDVTRARGGIPDDPHLAAGDAWTRFSWPTEVLNAVYMHYTRNKLVLAAANHLKGKLALVGKGWDKLGLRANMEHARDKSGIIYGQSQVSLNLFGGCVHGGMPLRPFDIAASNGLILTHDQRELPDLFEPGKECLAFRSADEMLAAIARVRAAPADFNAIAQAGRRRVLAEHAWVHRTRRLIERLGE